MNELLAFFYESLEAEAPNKQTQIILSKLEKKKYWSFEEESCPGINRHVFQAGNRSQSFFREITTELG